MIFQKNLPKPLPTAVILGKWSKFTGDAYTFPGRYPMEQKDWKYYYCFSGDPSVLADFTRSMGIVAEGKGRIGMEMATRVLNYDKQGCAEFKAAMNAVMAGGKPWDPRIGSSLIPSCTPMGGLHVHVGDRGGLKLSTAKRVAILGWLLEPCLFSLCSHGRGRNFHSPARKNSILAAMNFEYAEINYAKEEEELTKMWSRLYIRDTHHGHQNDDNENHIPMYFSRIDRKRIAVLANARSMQELETLLSYTNQRTKNRRLCLAIYNRVNDHTTIEFRHFQGTHDPELAWEWVRLVTTIVQIASTSTESEFQKLLREISYQYRAMRRRSRDYLIRQAQKKGAKDPWLDSWTWMLPILNLNEHEPFWSRYVARLPERNEVEWGGASL